MKSPIGPKVLSQSTIKINIKADGITQIKYAKLEKLKLLPTKIWSDKCITFDDGDEQLKLSLAAFEGHGGLFYDDDLHMLQYCTSDNAHVQKVIDYLPDIIKIGITNGYINDFRPANIMMRSNGDIVITDPYATTLPTHTVRLSDNKGRAIMATNRKNQK